jgi:broad specificity phosphatase PhoE
MPRELPPRASGVKDYRRDCPLTLLGQELAKLLGVSFAEDGIRFSACYVSSAYRCIQTAHAILTGAEQSSIPLFVEPGLFERINWPEYPVWFTPDELFEQGFNVARDYTTFYSRDTLPIGETYNDYYERQHDMMQHVLSRSCQSDSVTLIVAHASSLDACSRLLCHPKEPTDSEVCVAGSDAEQSAHPILAPIIPPAAIPPPLATLVLAEHQSIPGDHDDDGPDANPDSKATNCWSLIPFPGVTAYLSHDDNFAFDYRVLLQSGDAFLNQPTVKRTHLTVRPKRCLSAVSA